MDRRPHWDDALLESVQKALMGNLGRPAHECMYAVIAAVEDWHSRQSGCEPPCTCWYDAAEQRLRAEEAGLAIQRVLELHTSEAPDGYEYEFDMTVRGGHWVQCDCCDSANCCDNAVRTCLACGDDMPCPTVSALDGTP